MVRKVGREKDRLNPRLCDCKTASQEGAQGERKSNDLAAGQRGRAVGGDGERYSFHLMGLLGKGDRS